MNNIDRFLNRKLVKIVIGEEYVLTDKQYERLTRVFDYYGSPKKIEDMLRTLAFMVKNDLTNYLGRIKRLKGIPGTSKYTSLLRYGKEEMLTVYSESSRRKTKHFTNKLEYWLEQGCTVDEARQKVSAVQKQRSLLSPVAQSGTSEYSCRSTTFWLKRGYSKEDAQQKVRQIQVRNGIEYYISKGLSLSDATNVQRKRTSSWLEKLSLLDQELLNLKKGHSVESYVATGYSYEDAVNKSIQYYKKRKNYSAISQDLFDMIVDKIPEDTIFYGSRNREFQIKGKLTDFYHLASKVVVEFYGNFWHRHPAEYSAEFEVYGLTSSDIWKRDEERINALKESTAVNTVVIIWESDFRNNPTNCVEQVLKEIKCNTPKKK